MFQGGIYRIKAELYVYEEVKHPTGSTICLMSYPLPVHKLPLSIININWHLYLRVCVCVYHKPSVGERHKLSFTVTAFGYCAT
jgi:hypothetical protein